MLNVESTTLEKVPIRIAPVTDEASGSKPAKLDGLATLSVLTGGASVEVATQEQIDADTAAGFTGLVGYLVSEDSAGISTYGISADADLGSEVKTITDGGTYVYNDPLATNFGLSAGTPIAK